MRKKLIILLMTIIFMLTITGCVYYEHDGQTDFFVYQKHRHFSSIVDLTDAGKKQSILIIPESLEGVPVTTIGIHDLLDYQDGFYSEHLKTLIVPSTVKTFIGYGGGGKLLDTVILNSFEPVVFLGPSNDQVTFYVPSTRVESYRALYEEKHYRFSFNDASSEAYKREKESYQYNILPANVSYMNNYSDDLNGGYYWIEQINREAKLTEPLNPSRKGYQFDGWYKEESGMNKWDFNQDIKSNITEETILYAKWVKND